MFLNKQIRINFYTYSFVLYSDLYNFASVTNKQRLQTDIKMAVTT